MDASVPILMYHHVSPTRPVGFGKYTVLPEALRAHLRLLRRMRLTTVTLDDLLAARNGGPGLPPRPVVLTFDDGFAEAVERAVPILQEFGARATFFLVAGRLGGRSDWLARERGVDLPIVDPGGARRLTSLGFDVGSHSWSHPHLAGASPEALTRELRDARHRLEDVIGAPVGHLAYPHGDHDLAARDAAAEAGYRSACTTEQRFARTTDGTLALPRIIIDGRDRLPDVACRLRTARSVRGLVRIGAGSAIRRLWRGPALDDAAASDEPV